MIIDHSITSANVHDSTILTKIDPPIPKSRKRLLMDKAYHGQKVKQWANNRKLRPIVLPKRNQSHKLHHTDNKLLKHRWRIEQVNGQLRRSRSINTKWTKSISTYQLFLKMVIMIHMCRIIYFP